MKINSSAHRFLSVRVIVICLALVGMVGITFGLSESLAARYGQGAVPQSNVPAVAPMSLNEMMFSMR
jgi:hypothetical protein